jgi:DNA repair exonuclease SbcCD ATPase subunit
LIIEDLLEIDMFSKMNVILKQMTQELKFDRKECEFAENLCRDRIASHEEFEKKIIKDKEKRIQEYKDWIAKAQEEIRITGEKIAKLTQDVTERIQNLTDATPIKETKDKLTLLQVKLSQSSARSQSELDFFEDHSDCPTCKQPIAEEFRTKSITSRTKQISDLDGAIKKVSADLVSKSRQLSAIADVQNEIAAIQGEIRILQSKVTGDQNRIGAVEKEIVDLQTENVNIEDTKEKLAELKREIDEIYKTKAALESRGRLYKISRDLLKDSGIKTIIIKQYLPIINKLVNKYLASLNFFVNFHLSETFEETIKSRFRDDFSYNNFSEGERQRIDLALLFTWREIARMKNSLNVNILLFDEVFDSSLDMDGTDNFMGLLNAIDDDCNVFVISHTKDLLADKFDDILRFEKQKNFSTLSVQEYNGSGDVA